MYQRQVMPMYQMPPQMQGQPQVQAQQMPMQMPQQQQQPGLLGQMGQMGQMGMLNGMMGRMYGAQGLNNNISGQFGTNTPGINPDAPSDVLKASGIPAMDSLAHKGMMAEGAGMGMWPGEMGAPAQAGLGGGAFGWLSRMFGG